MKVLVMGGTQFNGLALVHELVRNGHEVTILNRGKTEAPLPRSVRRLIGDRTDHARLREVFRHEEFDCIQDMSAYHPEDVQLMIELFRGRTGHYVFASSTVIYAPSGVLPIGEDHPVDRSDRQNEYGMHKLLCEDLLIREHRSSGFPATIVPFSMVFGPRNIMPDREQRMFARLLQGRPVLVPGDGTTLGQVGHVDDQARALRMLMGNPITFGKRYNLTGGQYYSDEGYIDTFASVVGVEPRKVFVPAPVMDDLWDGRLELDTGVAAKALIDIRTSNDAKAQARATEGRRLFALSRLVQRLAPNLHRWNSSTLFSIERLKHDIGWTPEFTFPAMVEHTYEWFRREGLDSTLEFDWTFEDQLLAHLGHP
jgi:nucleoside-diphosphate-sugar epimerase